jgi:hypothetical protein
MGFCSSKFGDGLRDHGQASLEMHLEAITANMDAVRK